MKSGELGGYRLDDLLGEGGMGMVYKAYDPTLDRTAAIKVIRKEALSAEGKQRFLREARACSRISHPNIITVYAAGEEDGTPFMAMEFLSGRTLDRVIEEGPVEWEQAGQWIVSLLDAVGRLHEEGIVHRDLKPENIMLTDEGVIKLMDFGVVHLTKSTALTQDGTAIGTVPYMSPEQATGQKVDGRADLYAIATILQELLTGEHPFSADQPLAIMYRIQNEIPRPVAEYSEEQSPPGLQEVLDRAFVKDIDARFATASEFRAALVEIVGESKGTTTTTIVVEKSGLKTKWFAIVISAAVVAALALGAWKMIDRKAALGDRDLARNLNEQGQVFQRQGDLDAAEIKFREAIAADETYPLPWNNLGYLFELREEVDEAEVSYLGALKVDPNDPAALFNLGNLYFDRNDFPTAQDYFERAVAADSTLTAGYNNLGAVHLERGNAAAAAATLDIGLGLPADDQTRVRLRINRARASAALGDTTAARGYLLGLTPESAADSSLFDLLKP